MAAVRCGGRCSSEESGRSVGSAVRTATTPAAIQFISYTVEFRITAGDGSEGVGCGRPV